MPVIGIWKGTETVLVQQLLPGIENVIVLVLLGIERETVTVNHHEQEIENENWIALETVTAIVNDRLHYLWQGLVHPVSAGRRRPLPCAT